MKTELLLKALKPMIPMAFGALGVIIAMQFPAQYTSFCAGRIL